MIIDNGSKYPLVIAGVFDGMAGVSGGFLSFAPNRTGDPAKARAGILAGEPILIAPVKEPSSPFWSSRFEVLA